MTDLGDNWSCSPRACDQSETTHLQLALESFHKTFFNIDADIFFFVLSTMNSVYITLLKQALQAGYSFYCALGQMMNDQFLV